MRSLRARLLASFALVIALCLVGGGFVSIWLLRDQQAASAQERIGRLLEPISNRLRQGQVLGWTPERIADDLATFARYFDVRILLVDSDHRVSLDTDIRHPMVGEIVEEVEELPVDSGPAYHSTRARMGGEDLYFFRSTVRRPPPGAPARAISAGEQTLIVAVPAADVTAAWARLLPRLLVAGGAAALVATIVAAMLARRITQPILQMTNASEAMARGDYSQRIDVLGDDEVGMLGRAFNQMAQQVDRNTRATRQLIADVSHDLKTPLTSIQGFSQAMLDGVLHDEDERVRAVEVVHEEAERMRGLIEDLLYLSQIEAGQLPIALETMNVDDLVAAAARRFHYQAETAEVEIRMALDGAPVRADERRLEQVLANLMDNAIRYAPAGSEVLLRTVRIPGAVLIEVHNGGTPIPAEDLPHVFDRFYQVARARTRDGHSGLGLAIVRELVQAHGGTVAVQSEQGAGTVFTVRLPIVPAPPTPASGRGGNWRTRPSAPDDVAQGAQGDAQA